MLNTSAKSVYPEEKGGEEGEIRATLLSSLIKHSVVHSEQGNLVSTKGKPLNWIVDTRVLLLDPPSMKQIGKLFLEAVQNFGPYQLACLEMTGIPLMAGIQMTALA